MELTLEGKNYKTGRIDPWTQSHVARRLMPVYAKMGQAAAAVLVTAPKPAEDEDESPETVSNILLSLAGPMSEMVAMMPDKDWDFILATCLAVCERQAEPPAQGWAKVMVSNRRLMFEDITLSTLMQLVFAVVRENMGNFFRGPPVA